MQSAEGELAGMSFCPGVIAGRVDNNVTSTHDYLGIAILVDSYVPKPANGCPIITADASRPFIGCKVDVINGNNIYPMPYMESIKYLGFHGKITAESDAMWLKRLKGQDVSNKTTASDASGAATMISEIFADSYFERYKSYYSADAVKIKVVIPAGADGVDKKDPNILIPSAEEIHYKDLDQKKFKAFVMGDLSMKNISGEDRALKFYKSNIPKPSKETEVYALIVSNRSDGSDGFDNLDSQRDFRTSFPIPGGNQSEIEARATLLIVPEVSVTLSTTFV